jgi:hypothetical protein
VIEVGRHGLAGDTEFFAESAALFGKTFTLIPADRHGLPPFELHARTRSQGQRRRHSTSRVAATSHHTMPGSGGGILPAVSAWTQTRDEPGKRLAKISG